MSDQKTLPTDVDVIAFLENVENEQKKQDSFTLLEIMQEVTKEKPTMWGSSIVGFGNQHYKYDSGREGDWPLVGFSPRKQAISIYGLIFYEEINKDLLEKLGSHKAVKGCVYVKRLSDIDISILKKMIKNAFNKKSS